MGLGVVELLNEPGPAAVSQGLVSEVRPHFAAAPPDGVASYAPQGLEELAAPEGTGREVGHRADGGSSRGRGLRARSRVAVVAHDGEENHRSAPQRTQGHGRRTPDRIPLSSPVEEGNED